MRGFPENSYLCFRELSTPLLITQILTIGEALPQRLRIDNGIVVKLRLLGQSGQGSH